MNIYKTGDVEQSDAPGTDEVPTSVFEGNVPEISVAGSTPEENATEQTTEVSTEAGTSENTDNTDNTTGTGAENAETADTLSDDTGPPQEGD